MTAFSPTCTPGRRIALATTKTPFSTATPPQRTASGAYEDSKPYTAVMTDTCTGINHTVHANRNTALQNTPRHDLAPCFQNHVPGNDGRRVNQRREGKTLSPGSGVELVSGGACREPIDPMPKKKLSCFSPRPFEFIGKTQNLSVLRIPEHS